MPPLLICLVLMKIMKIKSWTTTPLLSIRNPSKIQSLKIIQISKCHPSLLHKILTIQLESQTTYMNQSTSKKAEERRHKARQEVIAKSDQAMKRFRNLNTHLHSRPQWIQKNFQPPYFNLRNVHTVTEGLTRMLSNHTLFSVKKLWGSNWLRI